MKWFNMERKESPGSQIVLLGLHSSKLERQVSHEEAFRVAFEKDESIYVEVCSSEMKNIYVTCVYSYLYRLFRESLL